MRPVWSCPILSKQTLKTVIFSKVFNKHAFYLLSAGVVVHGKCAGHLGSLQQILLVPWAFPALVQKPHSEQQSFGTSKYGFISHLIYYLSQSMETLIGLIMIEIQKLFLQFTGFGGSWGGSRSWGFADKDIVKIQLPQAWKKEWKSYYKPNLPGFVNQHDWVLDQSAQWSITFL